MSSERYIKMRVVENEMVKLEGARGVERSEGRKRERKRR